MENTILNFRNRLINEIHFLLRTWTYVHDMIFAQSATGMRILVMLLLDTLPMLGNVLLLCFFVFFIFGIVGVQLWEGILRQRCFLKALPNVKYPE